LATLGAPERRTLLGRRRRGRPRAAEPSPAPAPVTTGRATLIGAQPFADAAEAEAWLGGADGEAEAAAALAALNRVLHAQRLATADAAVHEVAREQALVVRIGIGGGEQVAEGRWSRALELPAPQPERLRRPAALRSQERLAALLGGRDAPLACEDLALRARGDLAAGRVREAAFQLRVALEAAIAELEPWSGRGDIGERLEELRRERAVVGATANAALQGGLGEEAADDVERVLGRLEAALRARTALGFAE
ncbi:MAG TPA: hypothetical protein VFT42_00570, partial [Solirubrobacteraceae bacterium]|nr:hypothetical protein [Solirubrobacteraceae bacterium]